MAKTDQANIIKPQEVEYIRYPLPKSLLRAAGLLRHRRKELERHLQSVRREWMNRFPRT